MSVVFNSEPPSTSFCRDWAAAAAMQCEYLTFFFNGEQLCPPQTWRPLWRQWRLIDFCRGGAAQRKFSTCSETVFGNSMLVLWQKVNWYNLIWLRYDECLFEGNYVPWGKQKWKHLSLFEISAVVIEFSKVRFFILTCIMYQILSECAKRRCWA